MQLPTGPCVIDFIDQESLVLAVAYLLEESLAHSIVDVLFHDQIEIASTLVRIRRRLGQDQVQRTAVGAVDCRRMFSDARGTPSPFTRQLYELHCMSTRSFFYGT